MSNAVLKYVLASGRVGVIQHPEAILDDMGVEFLEEEAISVAEIDFEARIDGPRSTSKTDCVEGCLAIQLKHDAPEIPDPAHIRV